MNPASLAVGRSTRARFVGAARPHTPRLHSPPQEADAERQVPRPRGLQRLPTLNERDEATTEMAREIRQHPPERYSFKLGGFIFDALPAHFSVSVSRGDVPGTWRRQSR